MPADGDLAMPLLYEVDGLARAPLVLAHFGDPKQIARGYAWVYRHERRIIRALAPALSTVLLASCLSPAILAAQAALAFGFAPVMSMLASPHMAIEALDIMAFVATYLGVSSLESTFFCSLRSSPSS
jgi:hypothetical protein